MKYFNSTVVADYIIRNTFDITYKKDTYFWENYPRPSLPLKMP